MCFNIITVNIRVSIRVRGLHLVWWCFWGSFSTSHHHSANHERTHFCPGFGWWGDALESAIRDFPLAVLP